MLNGDPKLSKDKLTCVRQRQEFSRKSTAHQDVVSGENVALFSEYAVLDRINLTYLIGIVERIRCNGRDYICTKPLNSPKRKDLSVVMSVYKIIDEDLSLYSTVGKTLRTIPFTDLICEVILKTSDDHLVLSRDDVIISIHTFLLVLVVIVRRMT